MRGYVSMFRIRLLASLQYRAAAWAGVATQFFWGFMQIMIFEAFYKSTDAAMPMTFSQLCTYIWLQQASIAIIMLWNRDSELFEMITTGNVAYELCRPYRLYTFWYARLLATRIASAALRFFPILFVAFLLPYPYKMTLPPDAAHFLLFLLALAVGILINVALSMLIYILTFITLSPIGSMILISVGSEFFSGSLIPIPYMPEWLQQVTYALPFRYTADLPLRLYNGNLSLWEGLSGLGIALLWLLALLLFGGWAMRRVLRRAVVQGG